MANKQRTNVTYPIALMVLIFVESSIPMDGAPNNIRFLTDLDPTVQNLLHIPLFGMLAFFWMNAFKNFGIGKTQTIIYGFCISVMYGALDEYHQSFVSGRYAGLLDIYLNTAGALISCFVFFGDFIENKIAELLKKTYEYGIAELSWCPFADAAILLGAGELPGCSGRSLMTKARLSPAKVSQEIPSM